MSIRLLATTDEFEAYDAWVQAHPEGNLWQSLAWKKYQEALGREVRIYALTDDTHSSNLIAQSFVITALVVIDRTAFGLSVWEIPRGPLMSYERRAMSDEHMTALLQHSIRDARKERCIQLLYSPTQHFTQSSKLQARSSKRHIHPEASLLIDLTQSEEEILKQMHQKGRYNINLARKHGVEIVQGSVNDIDDFYQLLTSTGSRDNFTILQKSRYKRFLESLDLSHLLLAKHNGKTIAGALNVIWNGVAYYYYGASSYENRHLMAPYLLQFEAMRRAKASGCHTYDLLGIMPIDAPKNDPWKGITDFKRKFGGKLVTYPLEQCCILRPIVYRLLQMKRGR